MHSQLIQFPIILAAMTWPATWRPLAHARCAWWRQRQKDQISDLSVLYLFCAFGSVGAGTLTDACNHCFEGLLDIAGMHVGTMPRRMKFQLSAY